MIDINKKGDVTMFLILAIVAVVVLVLAVIAFTGKGGELSRYAVGLFPWFNNTKGTVQGTEILRYSIINDKVQYYDGSLWKEFSKGTGSDSVVEFNNKKIMYTDAYNAFRNEYYAKAHESRGLEEIELTNNAANSFSITSQDLKAVIVPTSYVTQINKGVNPSGTMNYLRGDIAVNIVPKSGGSYLKVYLIRLDGSVFDLTAEPSWLQKMASLIGIETVKAKDITAQTKGNEDFQRIISGVNKWRSSTLSNAVQLSYSVVDEKKAGMIAKEHTETKYFCPKPIDYDLVIYVDTPSTGATC